MTQASAAAAHSIDLSIYRRRRLVNGAALTLALGAAGLGLFWLVAILWTLLWNGLGSLSLGLVTQMTPPPGSEGGLLNAIFGTVVMTTLATALGTPIGILAGTWLAEFGKTNKLAELIRFINDILLSAPSIIVGLFVYEVLVIRMGHFSAWAGAVALAVIVIPVVVRTTEDMLKLVPNSLREAAAALGAPQWKVVTMVAYRAARNGMITGVLLAIARISGETAPLLFTALNNQFWSTDMNAPMANLPVVIFQYAMSPYEEWQRLAWGGALLITLAILILNIGARAFAALSTTSK
ncbi:phosphate ABC transporter permease PstA [Azospirillum sp.]|uniref:phosphate ABC transporter permease PstA n=1 Tax=Azospirillum sp. TaxID=34012 RepID=UPI003D723E12